jgi:hypothetical protein
MGDWAVTRRWDHYHTRLCWPLSCYPTTQSLEPEQHCRALLVPKGTSKSFGMW